MDYDKKFSTTILSSYFLKIRKYFMGQLISHVCNQFKQFSIKNAKYATVHETQCIPQKNQCTPNDIKKNGLTTPK